MSDFDIKTVGKLANVQLPAYSKVIRSTVLCTHQEYLNSYHANLMLKIVLIICPWLLYIVIHRYLDCLEIKY